MQKVIRCRGHTGHIQRNSNIHLLIVRENDSNEEGTICSTRKRGENFFMKVKEDGFTLVIEMRSLNVRVPISRSFEGQIQQHGV